MNILESLYPYIPAIILVIGAIFVLIVNAVSVNFSRNLNIALSMLFIMVSFISLFSSGIDISRWIFLAQSIILIASFSFIFLAVSGNRYEEFQTPEFYSLYLFALSGFIVMVNANNLILMLLGLELGSMPLAALLAFGHRQDSIEVGIKYFVMSALASIFLILGITLFYFATGHIDLDYLNDISDKGRVNVYVLCISLMFMIAGIGFKISLVPWQNWMPDTYEGANPVLAGYISVVPKIAGFIMFAKVFLLIQIFASIFSGDLIGLLLANVLKVLIFITITVPNIMALIQKDVKRMLAYSSISHSGFALSCIYLQSMDILFVYWILFFITNLGAFGLLWMCNNKINTWHDRFEYPFEKFQGLVRLHPFMSIVLAIFMISLAGVPPFSIFWGKILIVMKAISRGEIALSIVMMINSAIAVYFYLKLIVFMFFKKPLVQDKNLYIENKSYAISIVVGICAILCICSIFLLSFIEKINLLQFV